MPVVRLRHKKTGQEIYVANFQNPASVKKFADQEKWRDAATEKQIALVNRLRKETGLPVFLTGNMNERDGYDEKMTARTDMTWASTGSSFSTMRRAHVAWQVRGEARSLPGKFRASSVADASGYSTATCSK